MTRRRERQRGQGLVEVALVIPIFLVLLMGIIDFGRGIYLYNGVSQAAREVARVTSVHPYPAGSTNIGTSTQTAAVIATQRNLIPNLEIDTATDIVCIDIVETPIADNKCRPGDFVRVTASAPWQPITPIIGTIVGTYTFESASRIQFP